MSEAKTPQPPDAVALHLAYAEASVMVLECLMRVLIERKVVSLDDMLEAVDDALETKRTLARDGVHPEIAHIAAGVLSTLANSLAASSARGASAAAPPSD